MKHLVRNGLAVLTTLLAAAACGDNRAGQFPTAPTGSSTPSAVFAPTAFPGTSPNAIPIALGETVTGVVTVSDPTCDAVSSDPPEHCRRFAIAIPTSGVLNVQITTRGPYGFTLGIGSSIRQWGTTVTAGVQAGSTYEISVALHGVIAGVPSQTFELTTSLQPR